MQSSSCHVRTMSYPSFFLPRGSKGQGTWNLSGLSAIGIVDRASTAWGVAAIGPIS